MADFTNIPIGTGPAPLDLCQGVEILPKDVNFPVRVGISVSQNSTTLFDSGLTIVFSRLNVSAFYGFNMGVCGPALAFLFDDVAISTANASNKAQATLDFSGQQKTDVGLLAAFDFSGGVHITEQLYLPKSWFSPWKFQWKNAFDAKIQFGIDFIELLEDLIKLLIDESSEITKDDQETLKKFVPDRSSWSLCGSSSTGLFDGPKVGEITATPSFPIPINLVDYVPVLSSLNKSLHKIKGDLSLGPQFCLEIPVTMSIDRFELDGFGSDGTQTASFDVDSSDYVKNKDQIVVTAPSGSQFTTAPTKITTHVAYEVDFTFGLSVYFKVSACKLFSVSVNSPSLDLIGLLGFPDVDLGTINNHVGTSLSSPPCLLEPAMAFDFATHTTKVGQNLLGDLIFDFPNGFPGVGAPNQLTVIPLTANPPVPGLQSSVAVADGADASGQILFVFPNLGVPDGMGGLVSASPTSPAYTVDVTATVPAGVDPGCASDLTVTTSFTVENVVITAERVVGQEGPEPVWSRPGTGGIVMNAQPDLVQPDPDLAPPPTTPFTEISVEFPGPSPAGMVPVTVTLLDENRDPHATSDVRVGTHSPTGPSVPLAPTATLQVDGAFPLFVTWNPPARPGYQPNYASRFILVIDAGIEFGQTEFWLTVWNWQDQPD